MPHKIALFICRFVWVLFVFTGNAGKKPSSLTCDQLRKRYFNILTSSEADISDSIVQKRIGALDVSAGKLWNGMARNADREYLWESDKKKEYFPETDVHGSVSSRVTASFNKLSQLALAYRTKGSKFQNDIQLKKDILEGIDWMLKNQYNPSIPWYDNWWDWVIGVPFTLNNLLILMYDDLPKEQLDNAMQAMQFYAPNVTYEGASTGANKIWQCKIMALRGIISRNPKQIQMAMDALDTEFKYVTGKDGFYRDGSFIQHQWHPYTGGYGRTMLRELTDMILLTNDSEWKIPQKNMEMIFEWINNSFLPVTYKGAMMDMVRGREISRTESDRQAGNSLLITLLRLLEVAPEKEKNHLQSFIKSSICENRYTDFLNGVPTYLLSEAQKLLSDTSVTPLKPVTCNKIFASMDRMVHIQPRFAIALSMSSSRIENYETINGENLKGWHTGDGMLYLYDNDLRQYSDSFWPTVNAYRLAGTTEDSRLREAKTLPFSKGLLYANGYKSPQNWVGGSSICEKYGIAGMWFDAQDCSLEAKKSWLMVGNEIVAIGAGISSSDNRTIETTVENRKINKDSFCRIYSNDNEILTKNEKSTLNNCKWIHYEAVSENSSIGYFFPNHPVLTIQKETRTGSWFDINQPNGPKDPIQRSYFTVWFDHGKNPVNETYAYILLPGMSRAETKNYAKKPNSIILVNTPKVQAVYNKKEQVTGINFWEAPGHFVENVFVDTPASVIVKETKNELVIGISDPSQIQKTISVVINRKVRKVALADPEIEVLSVSPNLKLKVNVENALGSTKTITVKK